MTRAKRSLKPQQSVFSPFVSTSGPATVTSAPREADKKFGGRIEKAGRLRNTFLNVSSPSRSTPTGDPNIVPYQRDIRFYVTGGRRNSGGQLLKLLANESTTGVRVYLCTCRNASTRVSSGVNTRSAPTITNDHRRSLRIVNGRVFHGRNFEFTIGRNWWN